MADFDTEILLATYNGAEFLPDLLASLDEQTDQDWRLVVRDDGSTDETVLILRHWAENKGKRFQLLEDGRSNLGAAQNFGALLEACSARFFLPCDQDDAWLPDKIARLKAAILLEERISGQDTPLIVHTDVIVTDGGLRPLSNSFWKYQNIRMLPKKDPWKLVIWQNVVTGCAMIGNAALLKAALPMPKDAMVHDWWLGIVCAYRGRIVTDEEPSLLYRQHGENSLGAQKWAPWLLLKLGLRDPQPLIDRLRKFLSDTRRQAAAAHLHMEGAISPEQAEFLRSYATLGDARLARRKTFVLRHGIHFHGALRNAALHFLI